MSAEHNIKRALIIDDDEVIANIIQLTLETLDIVADVHTESLEGWEASKNEDYDLIIHDWKLPDLPGVSLFNRIRSLKKYETTPVLIVSGFLEKFDFVLLSEYACTMLLEKPFTKKILEKKLLELSAEKQWYDENDKNIRALVADVNDTSESKIKNAIKILNSAPNKVVVGNLMSKVFRGAGLLDDAITVINEVLKHEKNNIMALGELGKVLFMKKDFEKAAGILKLASKYSPENVERLVLSGEVSLNMNDPEQAKKKFAQALEIDSDNKKALDGIEVANNLEEHIGEHKNSAVTQNFASLQNIIAITKVRNGDHKEGTSLYEAAMSFVHDDITMARLSFNLGLGYLRWEKPKEAMKWFKQSAELGGEKFAKGSIYMEMISKGSSSNEVINKITEDKKREASEAQAQAQAQAKAAEVQPVEDDFSEDISLDEFEESFMASPSSRLKEFENQSGSDGDGIEVEDIDLKDVEDVEDIEDIEDVC